MPVANGDRLREVDHPRFPRAVGLVADVGEAVDGGDVDDRPASSLDHRAEHAFRAEERALQDSVDVTLPDVLVHQDDVVPPARVGVVDEHRDRAERPLARPDQRVDLGRDGHVRLHGETLAARRLDAGDDPPGQVAEHVADDDRGPLGRKALRHRPADARGTAGHENRSIGEAHPASVGQERPRG